jgi:hypothetical protein
VGATPRAEQRVCTVDELSQAELVELVEALTDERDAAVSALERHLAQLCNDAWLRMIFDPDKVTTDEKRREAERVAALLVHHVRPARRAREILLCWGTQAGGLTVTQSQELFTAAAQAEAAKVKR